MTTATADALSRAGRSRPATRAVGDTRSPSAFLRAVDQGRAELVLLLSPLASRLRTRGWRAAPATSVFLLAMLLFNLAPTGGKIGTLMRSASAVSAELPWWQAAMRLPASMFAPATNLPFWGALAQVAAVAAIAEALLSWRRMLLVGVIANATATAGARVMAWLGPHSPLGISAHTASLRDTGPSVLVTAVLVYLAVTYRTTFVLSATTLFMFGEVALTPNLAGREHLIGMATAAILAVTVRLLTHAGQAGWQPPLRRSPTCTSGCTTTDAGPKDGTHVLTRPLEPVDGEIRAIGRCTCAHSDVFRYPQPTTRPFRGL